MNIDGKCISDEELRGEMIHNMACTVVDFACDLSTNSTSNFHNGRLDVDEWHEMIDEMVTLLHAHKASEANR